MNITITIEANRISLGHLIASGMVTTGQLLKDGRFPQTLISDAIDAALELVHHKPEELPGFFRETMRQGQITFEEGAAPPSIAPSTNRKKKSPPPAAIVGTALDTAA